MSPVAWANLGPVSALVGRALPTQRPPTLVLSLPRSGSSWVGSTIGLSPEALYLREPISQPYLARHKRRGVVFRLDRGPFPEGYARSADTAFAGIPAFGAGVIKYPRQWSLGGRRKRRVVVKEVNPLAVRWLLDRYRPRVIYLIRHPAAVAASFSRLGWISDVSVENEERRFSARRMGFADEALSLEQGSAWAEHAALQALIMRSTLDVLAGYADSRVVCYEDICRDPLPGFRSLYEFAGLSWNGEVQQAIEAQTTVEDHNRYESYSLYRNSRAMAETWRSEVDGQALEEMKQAFTAYGLPYYAADAW